MRSRYLQPAARGLALLRIVSGSFFILASTRKMTFALIGGFLPFPVVRLSWQQDLPVRLGNWLSAHPSGILAAIIRDLVLPHGGAFAALIAWSQIIVGVLLVVGLFTRAAALVAGMLLTALALAAATSAISDARFYLLLGCITLALLIGQGGETLGLDGWRRERRRGMEF